MSTYTRNYNPRIKLQLKLLKKKLNFQARKLLMKYYIIIINIMKRDLILLFKRLHENFFVRV